MFDNKQVWTLIIFGLLSIAVGSSLWIQLWIPAVVSEISRPWSLLPWLLVQVNRVLFPPIYGYGLCSTMVLLGFNFFSCVWLVVGLVHSLVYPAPWHRGFREALIFQGVPRAIYFKSTTFVSGLVSASGLGLLYLICLAGTPDMFGLQGAGLCWYDGQLLQLSLALLGWIDIL